MRAALIAALLLLAPLAASAQDLRRGEEIASNGAGDVAACGSCHGPTGAAPTAPNFPRIAGLPPAYLFKQLEDYASGARENEIMTPIAQSLGGADRQALAAWFGAQAAGDSPGPPHGSELAQRLLNVGDAARGIQACANCHGPAGHGLPPLIPRIAGQNAEYAQAQFQAWRQGTRRNDVAAVMREVTGKLSEAETAEIAAYLQGLR